jgi:hypothetical protein
MQARYPCAVADAALNIALLEQESIGERGGGARDA